MNSLELKESYSWSNKILPHIVGVIKFFLTTNFRKYSLCI